MKMAVINMGIGLTLTGFGLMPFWFTVICVLAGLAEIEQERQGWK